jgi:hypothetical protein
MEIINILKMYKWLEAMKIQMEGMGLNLILKM